MAILAQVAAPPSNFVPLSQGYHDGYLTEVEVRDFEGTNYNTGVPETKTKAVVRFESETDPEISPGVKASTQMFLTIAYGDKAHLTIVRERLLGRPLTSAEMSVLDDETFIGKRVRVQVKHRIGKNGNTYGNIDNTSVVLLDTPSAAPVAPAAPVAAAADGATADLPF
tara:strand:- start:5686 stop:6189 length:504 start_codon:yes stop_codon:yes gene_type:complete